MKERQLLILTLLAFLLIACDNSKKSSYIISKEDSLKKVKYTREDGIVIMPPEVSKVILTLL